MPFCKPEPMSFNSRAFGQLPGSRPIYDSPFSFSHQNSVSKTQLHVYSYHLMIRPPRKCHERNQFTNSYYYMNDLSHKVCEAQREYTPELQIIVSYFHLLSFATLILYRFFPLKAQNFTTLESALNLIESS